MTGPQYRLLRTGPFEIPSILRGPDSGPIVLIAPPLFEEMNRCRNLLANFGRSLAARQIASLLPDLPGTGDDVSGSRTLANWQSAFAALVASCAAARPAYLFALRGGALLSDGAGSLGLYRFAPARSGARLLRDLARAQVIADQERTGGKVSVGDYEAQWADGQVVRLAGYDIDPVMNAALNALQLRDPAVRSRTASFDDNTDIRLEGPSVWRQAEPADTTAIADALAADFAAWIAT